VAARPDETKAHQRAGWAAGNYPDIARSIEAVSPEVVMAAGVSAGDDVLDVATGTGNAALVSARLGARVTGVDLTPELLDVARARAAQEGHDIDFRAGDAEALPVPDAAFDRVTSVFGTMFAPDHARTASELLRATRPGGTIAVSAWTPDGLNGAMFVALGAHTPPPPPGFQSPMLWGVEEHVRGLFAGARVTCRRRRAIDSVRAESPEAWVDYLERTLGPLVLAKRALELEGRWAAARADLVALYAEANEATDGTMAAHPDYLLTVVETPA
jgi:SAM-dependent methyltransferase